MRKKAIIISALVMLISVLFALAGCGNPKMTGIEITTPPAKIAYTEGESFDSTGMVVTANYSDGTTDTVTDFTVDKTQPLTLSDTTVTVTYNGFSDTVNITVAKAQEPNNGNTAVSITDVLINEDIVYTRTMDVSSIIQYKAVYSDGTTDSEWRNAAPDDLESYSIDNQEITLQLSLLVGTAMFDKTVTLQIADENVISVSELRNKTVEEGGEYLVEGVVVSIATTSLNIEYILKDVSENEYIGVQGIISTGTLQAGTYEARYAIGNQVRLPVTLARTAPAELPEDATEEAIKAAYKSDDNKVYAVYAGGELYETGVINDYVATVFDNGNVREINTQAALVDFLSAENRANNAYTMVKLSAPLYAINYTNGASVFYRFMFEGVTAYANQKIDGADASPVFSNFNQLYTTNETVGEILVGDSAWSPKTWTNPGPVARDIYAIFIGGNRYYHHFVILGYEMPANLDLNNYSFDNLETEYLEGEDFSLDGAELVLNYGQGAYTSDFIYTIPLTLDMLDADTLPDMTAAGTYTVTGSYGTVTFNFTVTVDNPPTAIYLTTAPSDTSFSYRTWQADATNAFVGLNLTITYSVGEPKEIPVTADMLSFKSIDDYNKQIVVTYHDMEATYNLTVTIPDSMTSVTQAKALSAGETVYDLNGIVISSAFISGTADSPANGEILLKDKANGNVIGLKDMGISYADKLAGLKAGDEIIVPVIMKVTTTSTTTSECGKITAYKVDGGNTVVLSSGNAVTLNFATAVSISDQNGLTAFLKDATTRVGNMYKLVKFAAGAKFAVTSTGCLYITFVESATTTTIKIDGRQPFLHIMNQSMTLGDNASYASLLLGDANATFGSLTSPTVLDKDVYLLYIGGQGNYYHQFVLLGGDYVKATSADNADDSDVADLAALAYEENVVCDQEEMPAYATFGDRFANEVAEYSVDVNKFCGAPSTSAPPSERREI